MIACPRCGHPNADDARYCSNCALALGLAEPPSEVCKTVTVMLMDDADLAEVLLAAGDAARSRAAMATALANFEAKGVTVEAARVARRLTQLA